MGPTDRPRREGLLVVRTKRRSEPTPLQELRQSWLSSTPFHGGITPYDHDRQALRMSLPPPSRPRSLPPLCRHRSAASSFQVVTSDLDGFHSRHFWLLSHEALGGLCMVLEMRRRRLETCLALSHHSSSPQGGQDPSGCTAASSAVATRFAAMLFKRRQAGKLSDRSATQAVGAVSRSCRTCGNAARWSHTQSSGFRPTRCSHSRCTGCPAGSRPATQSRIQYFLTEASWQGARLSPQSFARSLQVEVFVGDLGFDFCGNDEREALAAIRESVREFDLALVGENQFAHDKTVVGELSTFLSTARDASRIGCSARNFGINVSSGKRCGRLCSVRRSWLCTFQQCLTQGRRSSLCGRVTGIAPSHIRRVRSHAEIAFGFGGRMRPVHLDMMLHSRHDPAAFVPVCRGMVACHQPLYPSRHSFLSVSWSRRFMHFGRRRRAAAIGTDRCEDLSRR